MNLRTYHYEFTPSAKSCEVTIKDLDTKRLYRVALIWSEEDQLWCPYHVEQLRRRPGFSAGETWSMLRHGPLRSALVAKARESLVGYRQREAA